MTQLPGAADFHLWRAVASTIRPLPGKAVPQSPSPAELKAAGGPAPPKASPPGSLARPRSTTWSSLPKIEPARYRRLARGRDALAGVIDLHGLGQDAARSVLTRYILRAHSDGRRSVLVITGKGVLGDGVLRRRAPEWLGEAPLATLVAGVAAAHRRHGGEGAIYVALKRKAVS